MAGRTAGPIKTKLGIGTHVDPGSVLVKVKIKVIWRHLANDNKTPYRGRKGRKNSNAKRDKYGGQRPAGPRQLRPKDGYLQLVSISFIHDTLKN